MPGKLLLPRAGRQIVSKANDPLGWDPVAEGNRAGDGMARSICVESYLLACQLHPSPSASMTGKMPFR